jgi:hypothetical protein
MKWPISRMHSSSKIQATCADDGGAFARIYRISGVGHPATALAFHDPLAFTLL